MGTSCRLVLRASLPLACAGHHRPLAPPTFTQPYTTLPCPALPATAAKEIPLDGASTHAQQAFITEASRLASCRHPNVIHLLGVALTDTHGVVLLEYAEGALV